MGNSTTAKGRDMRTKRCSECDLLVKYKERSSDWLEQKARADLAEEKLKLQLDGLDVDWVLMCDYEKEKKRAEKAEAKLKKTADELERINKFIDDMCIDCRVRCDLDPLIRELSEDGK